MPHITHLRRTCIACPSQWEGRIDDGRHIYIRYRWGTLSFGLGLTETDAVNDAMSGDSQKQLSDGMDGELSDGGMAEAMRDFGFVVACRVNDAKT